MNQPADIDTGLFPKIVTCPSCGKKLKIGKVGRHRCGRCRTNLIFSTNGEIRFYPPESTAVFDDGQLAGLRITNSADESMPVSTIVRCLVCGNEQNLTVPARYRCSRCQSVWMVDQSGQVIFD